MKRSDFPADFRWGAATAAYQIEGAAAEDGRGECIWDRFSHTPGKVRDGDTGDVACDHYRRYREDVGLMENLGIDAYRFSLSWSRLLPVGSGAANQAGLDFYDRLIDSLLAAGIEPSATLYHWDLPQALQDRGGWAERDTVSRFRDYADLAYRRYGDRVKRWYTHNEPWVVAFAGHLQGRHAPGAADLATAVAVSHHLLLSHAEAVEAYRSSAGSADGEIGIVLNLYPCVPASASPADAEAAALADGYQNRWFLDPLYRGSYPADVLSRFDAAGAAPPAAPGDLERIAGAETDFLGVNYYFRKVLRAASAGEPVPHPVLPIAEVKPAGAPYTEIGWEVWPAGLTDLLLRLKADYGNPRLLVTENGAAFADPAPSADPEAGRVVEDEDRRSFLEAHFAAALDAIRAGARLEGFYVWSLMDNFEWAQGYSKRFGIFAVDYATQTRTWKRSALWYRDFLASAGPSKNRG
jgi:beta-glucosidase